MKIFDEFKKFVLRGNMIDIAIGFTVGAAFTTVAKSLVSDIIMPPVGLLLGKTDFSNLFFVLRKGDKPLADVATLKEAQEAGAVTLNYGVFINNLLALLLVAVVMFLVIRIINRLDEELNEHFAAKEKKEPANKKCQYCRSTIDFRATRCPQCTSQLK